MYSVRNNSPLRLLGFPIRKSPDQRLLTAPRGSIVVRHVLHRLLVPRHPPCALISLTSRSIFTLTTSTFLTEKVVVKPNISLVSFQTLLWKFYLNSNRFGWFITFLSSFQGARCYSAYRPEVDCISFLPRLATGILLHLKDAWSFKTDNEWAAAFR